LAQVIGCIQTGWLAPTLKLYYVAMSVSDSDRPTLSRLLFTRLVRRFPFSWSLVPTLLCLCAAPLIAASQPPDVEWSTTFGNPAPESTELGRDIQQTLDGGFVIVGTGPDAGGPINVLLIRIDRAGNLIWQRTLGGSYDSMGYSVREVSTGGYIVCGQAFVGGDSNALVIRTDAAGQVIWTKTFGGTGYQAAYSVLVNADGGFLFSGTACTGDGQDEVCRPLVVKLDGDGNVVWQREYGGEPGVAWFADHTADGGYVLSGNGAGGAFVVKLSSSGAQVWARTIAEPQRVASARQKADGGYIACGTNCTGITDKHCATQQAVLVSLDASGRVLWTKTFGVDGYTIANSVIQTPDGGFVIFGGESGGWGEEMGFLFMRTDSSGSLLWKRVVDVPRSGGISSGQGTSDGGYVAVGQLSAPGNWDMDIQIVKLLPDTVEYERVPVVIIPGIMGSRLCTVSSSPRLYLWNPDSKAQDLLSIILDKTLGPILSNPGLELLGWYASENAYGGLLDELTSAGRHAPFYLLYPYARFSASGFRNVVADPPRTLSSEDDLFVFPYDWRQDIKDIASNNLKRMIEKILEVTGAKQVDIVAHSLGGLVARYYINEAGGAQNVRRLVMVGVPHFGSVDAYSALHPDLGCMCLGAGASLLDTVCLKGLVSSLAGSFLSSYELLPMPGFFDLLDYFFVVERLFGESGPLDGGGDADRAFAETYFENDSSRLSNVNAVTTALNLHNRLGSTIETPGEVFVLTEWGIVTPRSLRRTWKPLWIPWATASLGWSVDFAPGDGRVLAAIGEGLEPAGGAEQRNYSLFTSVPHGEMLNDKTISGVIRSILDGYYWDSSWASKGIYRGRSGDAIDRPALEYTTYHMCSDTVFHLFDASGNHIGPTGDGVIETTPTAQYLVLGHSVVAATPNDGVYRIAMEPCEACFSDAMPATSGVGAGSFTFAITQYAGDVTTAQFLFEDVAVTDQSWRGEIRFNTFGGAPPRLEIDADGDGNPDSYLMATAGNTPLGFAGVLTFANGQIRIAFGGVASAGHTVCGIADAPEGISSFFHPVTPYFAVGSSASLSGQAEVTITYESEELPWERETSLGIYRIPTAGQIIDITTQRDVEGDTVTGETDGFSYFVVGYMNEPPDVSILCPTTGETVTGQSCGVQWEATDPDGDDSSVLIDLLYSASSGASWRPLVSSLANTGVFDWDITSLLGGEYRLKLIAEDAERGVGEATAGPFTISVFDGNIVAAPNPVNDTGPVFFYALHDGISSAELMVFNVIGRLLFETSLNVGETRFPSSGAWNPVDQDGVPLANGPYVYVLIADGRVIGQGKMVIQR